MRGWAIWVAALGIARAVTLLGCGGSSDNPAERPDAGTVFEDGGVDGPGPPVDASSDATEDAGAADASVEPRGPLLLIGVSLAAHPVLAASFNAGTWTTTSIPGSTEMYSPGGGGVAMTGADHGVVVLCGDNSGFFSGQWTAGTWSSLTRQGTESYSFLGNPASLAGKVMVANQKGFEAQPLLFGQFIVGSGWSKSEDTGAASGSPGPPAVVARASGSAMLVFAQQETYGWTTNEGGNWLASAGSIPGGSLSGLGVPSIEVARRAGTDEIVALMRSGDQGETLRWSLWSKTEWSKAAVLASNLNNRRGDLRVAATSLQDGRIALAYSDSSGAIDVGFFNGTTWTALKTVALTPSPNPRALRAVAIARGVAPGVVLELVYVGVNGGIHHARLTDEAGWTWTTPSVIQPNGEYDVVYLAASP